jgi:hypothetical protein
LFSGVLHEYFPRHLSTIVEAIDAYYSFCIRPCSGRADICLSSGYQRVFDLWKVDFLSFFFFFFFFFFFADPTAASRLLKLIKEHATQNQRDPSRSSFINIGACSSNQGLIELCMSLHDESIVFFDAEACTLQFPYSVAYDVLTSKAIAM